MCDDYFIPPKLNILIVGLQGVLIGDHEVGKVRFALAQRATPGLQLYHTYPSFGVRLA